jgi:hypothetical protein
MRMKRPGCKKTSVIGSLFQSVKKDYHCSLHLLSSTDEIKSPSMEFLAYPKQVQRAVNGVKMIADNLRKSDEIKMVNTWF